MINIRLFFIILIACQAHSSIVSSQDFELVGIIDGHLVVIDSLTGKATIQQKLQSLSNIDDLTYHSTNDVYYSLLNTSDSPSLVSISAEGEYQVIGSLTINGVQIPLVEALAYDSNNDKLYAGVSLNGGVSANDFYSESIVEVNPLTAECLFVTEISTNKSKPDIDVMAFNGTELYIADAGPPGANFLAIYRLDFNNISALSIPNLEYESTYLPIRDFTATSTNIYFTSGRNLYRYILNSQAVELIGTTHDSGEFNGEIIKGISKMKICDLPIVDLGKDQDLCQGESLVLDASNADAAITWQDGSSNSSFEVSQAGTYWVSVENICGGSSDTIKIEYNTLPEFDLGENQTICNNNQIQLGVEISDGKYRWQDGSRNSSFEVSQSGIYWVEVENTCGMIKDSIEIIFPEFSNLTIPNVFTPNGDEVNDYFEIDSRLLGSAIGIFHRNGVNVFESNDYRNNWDGDDLASGTYYWIITNSCGSTYKGWITLLY